MDRSFKTMDTIASKKNLHERSFLGRAERREEEFR